MRITQGMLTNQMMLDIQNNNSRLSRLQDEAASGKKINNPSDDPVGTGYIMRYKAQAAYYAQYKDNADQAKGVLDYTDTMLDQAHQVMQRARDLAVQGASDTVPADSKKNIAMEVDQLYQQLVTVGNSQYQGKYIFNGQQTTVAPYLTTSAETATTNTGQMLYDVGDGVQMNVNLSGNQVFGQAQDADNAFSVLKNLKTGLDTNNSALIQTSLAQIDTRTNT
ncbi:MAG: flagellar biosynthesis protein FlgL, partial [Bacilli bacterium]|nr:flagellar biosynthesis protein FlgL [Bacilli bacterium]